jgi:hypothetical protein
MNVRELLMVVLLGWTVLGGIGLGISLLRGERTKAFKGLRWVAVVWVVYLAVLVGVSLKQPQRVVALGQDQCYDEMCFTVVGADEIPRLLGKNEAMDGGRLIRVKVRVHNTARDKTQSQGLIRAYLVDKQGQRWEESKGVSGNRLTAKVEAGGTMVSEPVFKVTEDATGLELVFTRGSWQPGALVIGDSDSWLHRKTVVALGR